MSLIRSGQNTVYCGINDFKSFWDISEDILNRGEGHPSDYDVILRMINEGKVKTINNEIITIRANTFCIHGDHENAINIDDFKNRREL